MLHPFLLKKVRIHKKKEQFGIEALKNKDLLILIIRYLRAFFLNKLFKLLCF